MTTIDSFVNLDRAHPAHSGPNSMSATHPPASALSHAMMDIHSNLTAKEIYRELESQRLEVAALTALARDQGAEISSLLPELEKQRREVVILSCRCNEMANRLDAEREKSRSWEYLSSCLREQVVELEKSRRADDEERRKLQETVQRWSATQRQLEDELLNLNRTISELNSSNSQKDEEIQKLRNQIEEVMGRTSIPNRPPPRRPSESTSAPDCAQDAGAPTAPSSTGGGGGGGRSQPAGTLGSAVSSTPASTPLPSVPHTPVLSSQPARPAQTLSLPTALTQPPPPASLTSTSASTHPIPPLPLPLPPKPQPSQPSSTLALAQSGSQPVKSGLAPSTLSSCDTLHNECVKASETEDRPGSSFSALATLQDENDQGDEVYQVVGPDGSQCVVSDDRMGKSDQGVWVHVRGIPALFTAQALHLIFTAFEPVETSIPHSDRQNKGNRGYGLVLLPSRDHAIRAINALNGVLVQDKRLELNFSTSPGPRGPRFMDMARTVHGRISPGTFAGSHGHITTGPLLVGQKSADRDRKIKRYT
ncbi:uncharacterized protein BJ171DRAFT_566975 [Polychytrium aggregatum]|uniref:uncharacterized protein n=1 Tax=Polychytrium aggregatum TaxID=110093 RepID=UPI0022FDF07F|nr:uncharacterized protein BJ171DRAFT_566975 [Polychytrium aggregatum]KAI9206147.1 hypothetical protein BJ171DRAFT_566975 [Polychytrium aggregatum]